LVSRLSLTGRFNEESEEEDRDFSKEDAQGLLLAAEVAWVERRIDVSITENELAITFFFESDKSPERLDLGTFNFVVL